MSFISRKCCFIIESNLQFTFVALNAYCLKHCFRVKIDADENKLLHLSANI